MIYSGRASVSVGLLVVLVGCGPGGGSEPSASTATSPVRPAPGTVSVDVFGDRSQVRTESLAVGQSSVEVRIDEILSEFDAVKTPEGSVVTLPDTVLFDFDSAALKPQARQILDRIGEALALAGDRRVTIRGHTDARGEDPYNLGLSQRRAETVGDYFVSFRTLAATRFTAEGLGESTPIAPNQRPDGSDDPDGRQQNRRVEIILEGP